MQTPLVDPAPRSADRPAHPPLSDDALRVIAARASTHHERMTDAYEPVGEPRRRAERWRRALGDDAARQRRMQWDGLSMSDVDRAVRDARLVDGAPLPDWTDTLRACIAEAETGRVLDGERFLDPNRPVPFEHVLGAFVVVARRRLERRSSGAWGRITSPAMGGLERSLLLSLSGLCAPALQIGFSVEHVLLDAAPADGAAPADTAYRSFVGSLQRGGLRSFFREFSALARHVATAVEAWAANSARLLDRLHADWGQLTDHFADGSDPGPIVRVAADLSDPHRGQQTTHILTCEGGLRIVYKPRSLGMCAAFQEFLRWCAAHGLDPALTPATVVPRDGYGWMEHIAARDCTDAAEVGAFYERAGALLGLVYAFNGEDMHHENLIAAGAHPVLIDLEVLFCPPLSQGPRADRPSGRVTSTHVASSVRSTGMLPAWHRVALPGGETTFANIGGFFDAGGIAFERPGWAHVNTDRMGRARVATTTGRGLNVPTVAGEPAESQAYLPEVLRGFEAAYRFLSAHADAIVADDGPLAAFAGHPARHMFRNTQTYDVLMRKMTHPRFLRDGADGSLELDVLTQAYLKLPERPTYWPVVGAEIADLCRLDIPLFHSVTTDDRLFTADGTPLGTCFAATGLDTVKDKIRGLSDQDLALQRELIRGSFLSRPTDHTAETADDRPAAPTAEHLATRAHALTPESARKEARRIAGKIRTARLTTDTGAAAWMSLRPSPTTGLVQYLDVGLDVYEGCAGIAVFLADLARLDGDATLAQEARDAVQPVLHWLASVRAGTADPDEGGIGGLAGIGSYAYALARIGSALDDPDLLAAADQAAALLTPGRIAADTALDVVLGSAGAALALLGVHRATGDPVALAGARQCGEHLLAQRRQDPASGLRAWPTLQGRVHTGFSHGASGIAYALSELYRTTGEDRFLDAMREGLAFERSLFDSVVGNWRRHAAVGDAPAGGAPTATWCHGAPGVGLARAATLDLLDDEARRDLDAALGTTGRVLFQGYDHVCCGSAGRIQTLATAARALGRPDLHALALGAAQHVVDTSHARGSYALSADGCELLRPTFFQGLAGIGHTLLHLTHPDAVPSVALLG